MKDYVFTMFSAGQTLFYYGKNKYDIWSKQSEDEEYGTKEECLSITNIFSKYTTIAKHLIIIWLNLVFSVNLRMKK